MNDSIELEKARAKLREMYPDGITLFDPDRFGLATLLDQILASLEGVVANVWYEEYREEILINVFERAHEAEGTDPDVIDVLTALLHAHFTLNKFRRAKGGG